MKPFHLVSLWSLPAPVDQVWEAIVAVECWPRWWKYVQQVNCLQKGDERGRGAIRHYVWTSRLSYRLSFVMRVTRVERPFFLEGVASGELTGVGRWSLIPEGDTTRVRYEWIVRPTKPWMAFGALLLAPAFRWNHNQVMAEGGRGLARYLNDLSADRPDHHSEGSGSSRPVPREDKP